MSTMPPITLPSSEEYYVLARKKSSEEYQFVKYHPRDRDPHSGKPTNLYTCTHEEAVEASEHLKQKGYEVLLVRNKPGETHIDLDGILLQEGLKQARRAIKNLNAVLLRDKQQRK